MMDRLREKRAKRDGDGGDGVLWYTCISYLSGKHEKTSKNLRRKIDGGKKVLALAGAPAAVWNTAVYRYLCTNGIPVYMYSMTEQTLP